MRIRTLPHWIGPQSLISTGCSRPVAVLLVTSNATAVAAAVSAASVTTAETIAKRVRIPVLLLEWAVGGAPSAIPRRCLDGAMGRSSGCRLRSLLLAHRDPQHRSPDSTGMLRPRGRA